MNDPVTVYQRYKDDPLKFVREYFSEANKMYDGFVNRIATNMGHMELRSDLIDKRTAYSSLSGEPMSNFYIPMIRPSVDSVVDILMDIVRSPDPLIKVEAYVPLNAEPEVRSALTLSANKRERYINRAVSYDYGKLANATEDFFAAACAFPYAIMEMNTQYCYDNLWVDTITEPVLDEAGMLTKYKRYRKVEEDGLWTVYPEFRALMPWECRVDLRRGNGSWRYFFSWKDMSPDMLQSWVKTNSGDEKNVRKLIEEYLPTVSNKKVADRGSTYHATQNIQDALSSPGYRLIRSLIRMFNEDRGREEVRVLWWVEDVGDEYAIIKEEVLEDHKSSFFVSANYLLPGEVAGLSDIDLSASLQDMGCESFNMAMDKSRKNTYAPRIISSRGWKSALLEQPGALWEIDFGEAGISSVQQAYGSVYESDDPSNLILFGGLFEQRIQALTGSGGGVGMVSGQKRFPDKKTETLGQSSMREKIQQLRLARIASRHLEGITSLVGLADKKMGDEWFKLNERQLELVSPELGELTHIDLKTHVQLSLPSAKMALQDEDKFGKIAAIVDFTLRAMPMFPNMNPKGMASLMKLVYEAADIDNPDQYFDILEEQTQNNNMGVQNVG